MGIEYRFRSRSLMLFLESWEVLSSLKGTDLTFNETIRPWELGRRGYMVHVLTLQELCKLIRCKRGTIVHIEQGRWSILGDGFLQVHAQGLGRLGGHFINEGVLIEQTEEQQVLSTPHG